MNVQAYADYRKADRTLNTVYGQLMSQATPIGRPRLQAAQRDWIRFRDSNCKAITPQGGSVYPMMLGMCLAGMTKARTKELRGQLHCEEGDLGCGGHRDELSN